MSKRVAVTGGRDFRDRSYVYTVLDRVHQASTVSVLLVGDARGADTHALNWALARGIPFLVFRADWNSKGLAAGPLRNQDIIDTGRPDLVVSFPGGRGTADMLNRARRAGIELLVTGGTN